MKLPADGDALDKKARALVRKLKRTPEIFEPGDSRITDTKIPIMILMVLFTKASRENIRQVME